MARLDNSLGSPGDAGELVRRTDGKNPSYNVLADYAANPGTVYPDSSSSVDIVKPNFGIPNTFYFAFIRNGSLSKFQIMYRVRKRYTPSAAWAIDDSGGNVWTDWTDWTTEKGTVDDPGEEVATTKIVAKSSAASYALWTKAFAHKYSEVDEYDRIVYQFRVRAYNSVANTCGKWWQCELPVTYAPAITGLAVQWRSDGGFDVAVQTNSQRNVRARVDTSFMYDTSYPVGWRWRALRNQTVCDKTAGADSMAFTIPAADVRSNRALYLTSRLALAEDTSVFRPLSCSADYADGRYSVFTPQDRTEPTLPEPTITTDTTGQNLQVYVASSGDNYTDVQGSAGWTDLAGEERDVPLSFSYDSSAKRWVANYWLPPMDVKMDIRVAVVGDDWKAYKLTGVVVPSNGYIRFSRTLAHDRSQSVFLKYNQSVTLSDEIAGETVECVGREFPVSRYGGVKTRTIKLDASYIHPDYLGGNGWKNSVECLTQANDWVLRIPGGEVYRVMVSSLDRSTEAPTNGKLMDVSITCEVVGYDVS